MRFQGKLCRFAACLWLGSCAQDPGASASSDATSEAGDSTSGSGDSTSGSTSGATDATTTTDRDSTGSDTSGEPGEPSVGPFWLDPLGYAKPISVDVAVPDETSTPNKYYVDPVAGAGTSCSEATPCASLDDVLGQPGTQGGPAYIYVKAGTTLLNWYQDTVYGAPGQEIVIKPFGDGVVSFQSTSGTNNNIDSGSAHHIVFDGGPKLELEFVTNDDSRYGLTIRSSNITLYRCRFRAGPHDGPLVDVGSFSVVSNVDFINCEFHDANNVAGAQQNLYLGPGDGSTVTDVQIRNCIFRDLGGEAIEINPRNYADNILIEGNAFHNVGKRTCAASWNCRPAITIDGPSVGGESRNVTIRNNLMWDTGSGGVWDRSGTDLVKIYHNIIYDFANALSEGSGDPNPDGVSGYSNGGQGSATNNIIYDPDGTAAFDGSSFDDNNNLCSGCDVAWTANVFASVDPASSDFLKPATDSPSIDSGVDLGVTSDYLGIPRPAGNQVDIGAFEN